MFGSTLDASPNVAGRLDRKPAPHFKDVSQKQMGGVNHMSRVPLVGRSEDLRSQDLLATAYSASRQSFDRTNRCQLGGVEDRSLSRPVLSDEEIHPRQRLDVKLAETAETLDRQAVEHEAPRGGSLP